MSCGPAVERSQHEHVIAHYGSHRTQSLQAEESGAWVARAQASVATDDGLASAQSVLVGEGTTRGGLTPSPPLLEGSVGTGHYSDRGGDLGAGGARASEGERMAMRSEGSGARRRWEQEGRGIGVIGDSGATVRGGRGVKGAGLRVRAGESRSNRGAAGAGAWRGAGGAWWWWQMLQALCCCCCCCCCCGVEAEAGEHREGAEPLLPSAAS